MRQLRGGGAGLLRAGCLSGRLVWSTAGSTGCRCTNKPGCLIGTAGPLGQEGRGERRAVRHAVGTGRGAVRESWRRLAVAKRKVLTRVANSPERNNQVGGVVVLRCNLGCFGTKCFATRSQDTLTRRVTTTQRWPV